jgi:hypothetical protein
MRVWDLWRFSIGNVRTLSVWLGTIEHWMCNICLRIWKKINLMCNNHVQNSCRRKAIPVCRASAICFNGQTYCGDSRSTNLRCKRVRMIMLDDVNADKNFSTTFNWISRRFGPTLPSNHCRSGWSVDIVDIISSFAHCEEVLSTTFATREVALKALRQFVMLQQILGETQACVVGSMADHPHPLVQPKWINTNFIIDMERAACQVSKPLTTVWILLCWGFGKRVAVMLGDLTMCLV